MDRRLLDASMLPHVTCARMRRNENVAMDRRRLVVEGALSLLLLGCSTGTTGDAETRDRERDLSTDADASPHEARDGGANGADPTEEPRDGGADGSTDAGYVLAADCNTRTGGAWITFSIGNETLMVWSTNEKFNVEASKAIALGSVVTPVFKDLIDGTDCDGQWSWHPDPENLELASSSPECEGLPSDVESNKKHWLTQVDRFCPSQALIPAYTSAGP